MRALIVDDEEPARIVLRRLLGTFADVEIAGEASSGPAAIELAEATAPDALFLDIEMPGLNGFDTLAELRGTPAVVFVTAYDQYAVLAFETNALDYLLKPVQRPALERALERIRAQARTALAPGLLRELRSALYPSVPAKLAARLGRKIVLVPRPDILYVVAEDRLVFLCTGDQRFLTDKTLSEVESLLPAPEFVRIHRSTLVNLGAVLELYPWMDSGAWRLRLVNGVELDVSRDRVRELRRILGF